MSTKKTKIVLVDDHKIFRYGLKLIIESQKGLDIVGEACDGIEAVETCSLHNPNIIIMDINMPYMNGLEAIRELRERGIASKIIVLTASKKREYIITANKLGVKGYLLKESEPINLIKAIKEVSLGRSFLDPEVAMLLPLNKETNEDFTEENMNKISLLSTREYEVLGLLSKGLSNKNIGEELFISEKTVKNHVTQIYRKLEVKDRLQAVIFAYKNIKKD